MDQTLLIIFIAAIVLFILKGLMTEARNQRNEARQPLLIRITADRSLKRAGKEKEGKGSLRLSFLQRSWRSALFCFWAGGFLRQESLR